MGGIGRRLERLEGRGESCALCRRGSLTTYKVEWDHDHEADWDEEPRYCPACGRPDVTIVRWPEDLVPE